MRSTAGVPIETTHAPQPHAAGERAFLRRLLIALAVLVIAAALWKIADILLLAFASVLVALGFNALARPVARVSGLGHRASVGIAVALVVSIFTATFWVFGSQIASGLSEAVERATEGVSRFVASEGQSLKPLLEGSVIGDLAARAIAWGTTLFGIVSSFVLVLAAGIYFALEPDRYRAGLMKLVPRATVDPAAESLDEMALALRRWFGGQLLAMALVGVMTAAGLWLLGIPAALGLGVIAGLTEFVPILGPVAGAVPALLVASTQDWASAAWVAGLFVVIQQVENNVILPLVTGRAVLMPAAVAIFATLAMGVLFGPLGLLLGYPLAIAADVLIRRLYVQGVLARDVELPSDKQDESADPAEAMN